MQLKLLAALFLFHFSVILFFFVIFSGQGQLELRTTYLITTNVDGSASWIIEQRISGLSNISRYSTAGYLQEFSKNASSLVDRAWLIVGREMEAKNFKVIATVSHTSLGSTGTIKHQFDWVGFAETEGERLIIGDVFVKGFFFLGDGSLILEYPREYHPTELSPTPDELRDDSQIIKWHGVEDIDFSQANVILEKETPGISKFAQDNPVVFFGSIALVGIGSASLWFFILRSIGRHASSSMLSLRAKDEEEKVIALLKAVSGPVYQSTITEQLGVSRSKTSKLLALMESKGIVTRQRKGRDKVVVLKRRK